jgi:hypothetical protein
MKKLEKTEGGWGSDFSPVFLPLKHNRLPSQYATTEGNFLQMASEARKGQAEGRLIGDRPFMRLPWESGDALTRNMKSAVLLTYDRS